MVIGNSNAQPGFFEPPTQCKNQAAQQECVNAFCKANPRVFVCEALDCKKNSVGDGVLQQFAKLKCIQNVCTSNPSEIVCQKLSGCEETKRTEGLFPFIACVIELFQNQ